MNTSTSVMYMYKYYFIGIQGDFLIMSRIHGTKNSELLASTHTRQDKSNMCDFQEQ